jgi:Cu(I)/Ag(I) efflux system periplasmic protein CusF
MKRIVSGIAASVALASILSAAPVAAQHEHHHTAAPAASAVAPSEGTIKKIDKARGMVTIAHGPIANLGMDPMTMSFRVTAPKQLANLKAGDKVRFVADLVRGEIVIESIEAAK